MTTIVDSLQAATQAVTDNSAAYAAAAANVNAEVGATATAAGMDPTADVGTRLLRAARSGRLHYAVDNGPSSAVNVLHIQFGTPHTTIPAGLRFCIKIGHTNTGAVTLKVDGLAPVPVLRMDGSVLKAGDLAFNLFASLAYSDALGSFVLLGPSQAQASKIDNLPLPTISSDGGIKIAPTAFATTALAAVQSIPNGGEASIVWPTPVGLGTRVWNAGIPSRFYIPANIRTVRVSAAICFEASSAGTRKLRVLMDNLYEGGGLSAERKPTATGTDVTIVQGVPGIFDLVANGLAADGSHYLEVRAFQDSGASLNVRAANTWATLELLG